MTRRAAGLLQLVAGVAFAGCTCDVPATLGDASWSCGPEAACPAGQSCVGGLCQPGEGSGSGGASGTSSTGGSSSGSSGGSGGSSSGGTTGGLADGTQCRSGDQCQSGLCLERCCTVACAAGNTECGLGVSCNQQGVCNYPTDNFPCQRSCDATKNPEQETGGSCASGICTDVTTKSCPDGRPVCNQGGTDCVACYEVNATACGGTSCCSPSSGNCVNLGACPACILPTRPCTPGATATGPGSCCLGQCCPDLARDGGFCGQVCPGTG